MTMGQLKLQISIIPVENMGRHCSNDNRGYWVGEVGGSP